MLFYVYLDVVLASVYTELLLGFAGSAWNFAMQYVCYAYKVNMIMKFQHLFLTPKNLYTLKLVDF